MSKALTTPRQAASTKTCHTRTRPVSVSAARISGSIIDDGLRDDDDAVAVGAIGDGAADGGEEEDRNLAGERGDAEQRRRAGQADRRATTRPPICIQVPVERDELAAEEELVVAVPEGAGECTARRLLVHRAGARAARIAARCRRRLRPMAVTGDRRTTSPACSTAPRRPTCSFCRSAPVHAGQAGDWPSRVRYSKLTAAAAAFVFEKRHRVF